MPRTRITTRPLRESDWPTIVELFGKRGACGGCWCMAWRRPGREWERHKGASNRRAFRRLVTGGRASGALAFAGDEPVGWCSVAPRAEFRSLETKRTLATDWDERTWSVTCFFVKRGWRGKGVAARLLAEALRVARAGGARRIEGYPQIPTTARMPDAFAWTGLPGLFERAGFRREARRVYARALRPRS